MSTRIKRSLRIVVFSILAALVGLSLILILVVNIYVEPPRPGEQTLFIHAAHWESIDVYTLHDGGYCLDWNKGVKVQPVQPPTGSMCVDQDQALSVDNTVYRHFVDGHMEHSMTVLTYRVHPDVWKKLEVGQWQILTFEDGVVVAVRNKREVGHPLVRLSDFRPQ